MKYVHWQSILIGFLLTYFVPTNLAAKDKVDKYSWIEAPYDLTKSLPNNYVKDGSVDYSKFIQMAINQNTIIDFPPIPLMVSGIRIPSNKTLIFKRGSKLIMKASSKGSYNVLELRNSTNVTIVDVHIVGERRKHMGKDGQWGHGIGIFSANDITIKNPQISECWGDGIYIGKSSSKLTPSRNIKIINAQCIDNRRNGISIISVNGLRIDNPFIAFTKGQNPMYGIDIEPNDSRDELKNVRIVNPVTKRNSGGGILISLSNIYGAAVKDIDIEIIGHTDYSSSKAFRILCYRMNKNIKGVLNGYIFLKEPNWNNPIVEALDAKSLLEKNISLTISNPKLTIKDHLIGKSQLEKTIRSSISRNTVLNFQ